MKVFKKSICVFLSAAIVMSIAMVAPISASAKKKAKPKLNKKKITLYVGKSKQLKLKKAKSWKVKWKTSKKSVATVSSSGYVTAKHKGKATITAKYKGKKYKCKVTVKPKVTKLGKEFTLYLGDTLPLVIKNSWGSVMSSKNWKTTDKSVATVNQSGLVTPKKVGRVNVSAEDSSGNILYGTVNVLNPYTALKNYITKKGTLEPKSQMKYIEYTASGNEARIYYDASKKEFVFANYYQSSDHGYFVSYSIPENGKKNIDLVFTYSSSSLDIEWNSSVDTSKYVKNSNLTYTEVYATSSYNAEKAYAACDELYSKSVYIWDTLLRDKLEMKVCSVGYSSYK
jgi:hypothetical protein